MNMKFHKAIEELQHLIAIKQIQAGEYKIARTSDPREAAANLDRAERLHNDCTSLLNAIQVLQNSPDSAAIEPAAVPASMNAAPTSEAVDEWGKPVKQILTIALLSVFLALAGCSSTQVRTEDYPWHDPLVDEHGNVVKPPHYDQEVKHAR